MLPRWAPELASASLALPTRFETDIAVARELAALGDSHNPDDPYFAEFRKQVLARYGVARVEDLPVNYKGLVGMEGERLSSALFARYAHASFERQAAQLQQLDRFAWLSPVLALRRLSMAAAGTDLQSYRRFVEQAEAHRYQLVQSLNRLQAEKLKFASDRSSRDNRISATHWQGMADFQYEPAPPAEALQRAAPAAVVLLSWLAALMGALALADASFGETHAMSAMAWMTPAAKPKEPRPADAWRHELRLLLRSRLVCVALALLFLLASLAVWSGLREVARQQQTIARLADLQQQDLAAQALKHGHSGDAGSAAYYTFHSSWDPPSSAAFLALGLRDAAPYVLRIRALALQAQLHEGESFNPELALAGRFDFAFVLVYLAPLFLIALLYELVSGERRAGRLDTLLALPGGGRGLWLRRAGLRVGLVFACLVLPVLAGAACSAMPLPALASVLLCTAAYLAFWSGLSLCLAAGGRSSAAQALSLMGCWALLTLVLPTLAQAVLARAVPVHQGVDLMLAQRQAVHGAWDLPREATLAQFFRSHPEWRQTAPLASGLPLEVVLRLPAAGRRACGAPSGGLPPGPDRAAGLDRAPGMALAWRGGSGCAAPSGRDRPARPTGLSGRGG